MGTEIERKFLVKGDKWRVGNPVTYKQAYLNRDKFRTVRIRVAGNEAMLTVKGITKGISRAEYEYAVPMEDALEMLKLCEKPYIEKKRWKVPAGNLTWEIDEFTGENQGLIVAEIELETEDQQFEKPDWVAVEVTDDDKYFNSNLSIHPYNRWNS